MQLQVYDVFCMAFLDRPGAYYRTDQLARTTRTVTPQQLITQLRTYHRLIVQQQPADGSEVYLTASQLKDWWLMRPPPASRTFNTLLATARPPVTYDYSYVEFLKHFLPQSTRDPNNSQNLSQFFTSLALYVPLLLSHTVELRRSPHLASSAYSFGVFALRRIEDGKYIRSVQAVQGEVVMISKKESAALTAAGAAFSVLELDGEGLSRVKKPGQQGRKRQRVGTEEREFVVAGGVAFINHACERHANTIPAVWDSSDSEEAAGKAQWQVVTPERAIEAGEELFVQYSRGEDGYPCSMC